MGEEFGGKLESNQRRVIVSKLLDPIHITFGNQEELIRARNKLLPKHFYRTFYETSATLSKYVSIDTHVKHRMPKLLKIKDEEAFQPVAEFTIHEFLNRGGIERHLVWNQKKDPSGYISVFNDLVPAKRRADFHYDQSQRIGQRVSIACINTNGLIPATVHAKCESEIQILLKRRLSGEVIQKRKTIYRDVDIPVWIHQKARDQYGATITLEQLEDSNADMWISITEIRKSNLKEDGPLGSIKRDSICAKGHDCEWLCCGPISDSRTVDVWPWDGKHFHTTDAGCPIRSFENSGQPWIWEKMKKMWIPDWIRKSTVMDQTGNKRRQNDDGQVECKRCKACERKNTSS
ncbi:hypothetical protein G6011_00748 [Alternaria panax]|uniref:DUF7587 domain-containing protein n=1 Tax=Alternaria panax TaxID=48097 RepID=A0AAD4IIQ8_9PLEO|nr:hypothetical protein G6011_00748 [Alternaria panax]